MVLSNKIIKSFISKKGNQVVFRYPRKSDVGDMLKFANGLIEEDTFVLLCGKKLTLKEEEKFLRETLAKMRKREAVMIVAEVNGKYAGNARVTKGILRQSHLGETGIALVKEYREEGIGYELFQTLIAESKKLGLRLLTLGCFECNDRALHLYEKLGFKRAGIIPGALQYQGSYCGEIQFYLPL